MSTRLNDSEILVENPAVTKQSETVSRRHRHKRSFMRRLKHKLFRRKPRISGVRKIQIYAERRFFMSFLLGAVLLLVILIPLILWFTEIISTSAMTQ